MPIIIENLSYTYSAKTSFAKAALHNVNLTINDGDFLGIIGQTGSGKSTLVQHLNGLIKLNSGKIIVDGIDLSKKYDYKKLRSTVGMVFQYPEYQLFDETVESDIGFGPRNLGLSKEEVADRVKSAIELVGLDFESIRNRSPFELSGGQKRRVAIAGVIAMQPKILVLDEPTAGLDPKGKKDILELVRIIKQRTAPTIIMISHNMDEVNENCNKIAVMHQGELKYCLPPRELLKKADELKEFGLDISTASNIANRLINRGIPLPKDILKADEFISAIMSLYKGGRA